jgi:tetratricopeptide (TPR) repeat protein
LLAGGLAVALRWRVRAPSFVFFLAFMPVALLPTSNLIVPIGSIMGERFLYLPLVGFAACAAQLVVAAGTRARRDKLAAAVLACAVLACGVRTVFRNRDWLDDLRLWSSAVAVAPRSFRTHHGLAYALYQSDAPRHRNLDAVIRSAESAIRVLDARPLPDGAEPVAVSLNLGIYYQAKARADASAERAWQERALAAFERAARADRAQNESNRRNALRRGRAEEQTPDVGEPRAWQLLGRTRSRLGLHAQAAEAFAWQRHLQPSNGDAHLDLARMQMRSGKLQEAALTATQARILEPRNPSARALLVGIYQRLDPEGCALLETAAGRKPDPECPRVRADVCAAYRGLAELFADAERSRSAAEPWLRAARDHC